MISVRQTSEKVPKGTKFEVRKLWDSTWQATDGSGIKIRATSTKGRAECIQRLKNSVVIHHALGQLPRGKSQPPINWEMVETQTDTWTLKKTPSDPVPEGIFKTSKVRITDGLADGVFEWVTTWKPVEKSRVLDYWARDPKFTSKSAVSKELSRDKCEKKVRTFWKSPESSPHSKTSYRFGSRRYERPKRIPPEFGRPAEKLVIPFGRTTITRSIFASLDNRFEGLKSLEHWRAVWQPDLEGLSDTERQSFANATFEVESDRANPSFALRDKVKKHLIGISQYPKGEHTFDTSRNPWDEVHLTTESEMIPGISWGDIKVKRKMITNTNEDGTSEPSFAWIATWSYAASPDQSVPPSLRDHEFAGSHGLWRKYAIEDCYGKILAFAKEKSRSS